MKYMTVISYISSKYGLDCKLNVMNDFSTFNTPYLTYYTHVYVMQVKRLLITLYPRWPPSWIPYNA